MALEVAQVVMDANTVTTITNNINSLYSNAISQLTAYTFGVVALVGVLIPIIVTVIQSRSLKAEKENLEKHIIEETTKIKTAVKEDLLAELQLMFKSESKLQSTCIEEQFKLFENKLECADAATFHLQGNRNLDLKYFDAAAQDFCSATCGYLKGSDEVNGQRTLKLLIEDCLSKINKVEYESIGFDLELDNLLKLIKIISQNDRYLDSIDALNKARQAAKKREPILAKS